MCREGTDSGSVRLKVKDPKPMGILTFHILYFPSHAFKVVVEVPGVDDVHTDLRWVAKVEEVTSSTRLVISSLLEICTFRRTLSRVLFLFVFLCLRVCQVVSPPAC